MTNTNMDYDTTTGGTAVRNSAASGHTSAAVRDDFDRRISSETKPSFKTSELAVYVVAVIGVLIASAVTDTSDFGAQEAWRYITYLTVGYMVARGLAKAGARNFFDDNGNGSR
jgi:hypothetical protein